LKTVILAVVLGWASGHSIVRVLASRQGNKCAQFTTEARHELTEAMASTTKNQNSKVQARLRLTFRLRYMGSL